MWFQIRCLPVQLILALLFVSFSFKTCSADLKRGEIVESEINEIKNAQDAILGIPVESAAENTSFIFAGWFLAGQPMQLCNTNIIITVPNVVKKDSTTLKCMTKAGIERNIWKYYVDLNARIHVQTSQSVYLKELHPDYRKKGNFKTLDALSDVRNALEGMRDFIVNVIKECNGNPSCVFDRVWDQIVLQICGNDCFRDCTFDCDDWDVGCHLRKLDCERLKGQCKICESTLNVAKELVKAFLCNEYGICIP